MPEALILRFSGIGIDEYWAVNAHLGVDMQTGEGDWPEGLLVHAGGAADAGGLVVIEVWESRDAQAAFMANRLHGALEAAGVTSAPEVTWVSLSGFQTPGT